MLTLQLARDLLATGVLWQPQAGDRFVIDAEELTEDIFWISDLTVEVQSFEDQSILGFNGTTEWALDSVTLDQAIWLPREDQLRELLRGAFRSLVRLAYTYRVEIVFAGEAAAFEHPQPEDAYALALLHVLRRIA